MQLTVIVPDDRPGMQRMLAHELQFIDSEIIYTNWRSGLKKAQGDFICLLEFDSAVSKGSIGRQLQVFLDNPRYRKLAMVSPLIEFDNTEAMAFSHSNSEEPQFARTGVVVGAIIRRSSILKSKVVIGREIVNLSYNLSTIFWENGLRIMHDPNSIYYSSSALQRKRIKQPTVSSVVIELWRRECIA